MLRSPFLCRGLALRAHSNRQVKRIFGKPPPKGGPAPRPEVAPPAYADKDAIPFHVRRVSRSNQLPVYRDYRNGNTRVLTQVRRVDGDIEALASDLSAACGGAQAILRPGRVDLVGNHRDVVLQRLGMLGF